MIKLDPWQMLAALAILFAAIITAHIWAPAAVQTVVSMATTLFALLVSKREEAPATPAPPPSIGFKPDPPAGEG